ncbi:F-box protein FBW2 [Acorus calamus]|uniref:F-box protein FBW2 n=1 Tax=Acorus calamus TaxID=4465 RepID=A0AAV9DGQ5_ACOCL|nr:F-box protein FBW2 [Acorus calamus]
MRSVWEGLTPELMAMIVKGIETDEVARVVPFVCTGWRDAVSGPDCWGNIELEQWCRRVDRPHVIDFAISCLVFRSQGNLRRLSAFRIGDFAFSFLSNFAKCLTVLKIPMSEVTDENVKTHAKCFAALKFLDISYCLSITSKGIEEFGRHCKLLEQLRRTLPPPGFEGRSSSEVDDSEALAIANSMPGLRQLELAYGRCCDIGLHAIVSNCSALTNLDILGCLNVMMQGDLKDKCHKIRTFRDPWDDDGYFYQSSDDGNNSDGAATDSSLDD